MLYKITEKQAVLGICFAALDPLNRQDHHTYLPKELRMRWLGVASLIQGRNELLNERCTELKKCLFNAGFR